MHSVRHIWCGFLFSVEFAIWVYCARQPWRDGQVEFNLMNVLSRLAKKPGKPAILREFTEPGKLLEHSGNVISGVRKCAEIRWPHSGSYVLPQIAIIAFAFCCSNLLLPIKRFPLINPYTGGHYWINIHLYALLISIFLTDLASLAKEPFRTKLPTFGVWLIHIQQSNVISNLSTRFR